MFLPKTTFLVIGLAFSAAAFSQLTRKVLFIGNSYTSVNNLPQLVADIADNMGDELIFDSNTPGGYTLMQHNTNTVTQNKIQSDTWDYVVLQEQSQTPASNVVAFEIGAMELREKIKAANPCSRIMFYRTWGYENGDAANCTTNPPVCTYPGMDNLLHAAYMDQASVLHEEITPVGEVWKYIRQNFPSIQLYMTDGSHPSAAGSYLAACSFYASIFKKDPTLITYNYSLIPTDAAIIRNAVKLVLFDNLPNWNFVNTAVPSANFTYKIGTGSNEVIFQTPFNLDADSYSWDFGDGASSDLADPTHIYSSNGTYTITLNVSNCDLTGNFESTFQTTVSFCGHAPTVYNQYIPPCPSGLNPLWTQVYDSYQWYDVNNQPLVGETNQSTTNTFDAYSVLTTLAGCSEMSPPKETVIPDIGFYGFEGTGNFIAPQTLCEDDTLTLNFFGGPTYAVYEWKQDGAIIPLATTSIITATTTGNYGVRALHPTCPEGDNQIFEFAPELYTFVPCFAGLNKNDGLTIDVYPNPAFDIVTVKTNSYLSNTDYRITDLMSNQVASGQLNTYQSAINLSELSAGIYFLILDSNPSQVVRIIKN